MLILASVASSRLLYVTLAMSDEDEIFIDCDFYDIELHKELIKSFEIHRNKTIIDASVGQIRLDLEAEIDLAN